MVCGTIQTPEEDEEALSEIEAELTADRSEALRQLTRQGLTDWRKEKALEQLEEHKIILASTTETPKAR